MALHAKISEHALYEKSLKNKKKSVPLPGARNEKRPSSRESIANEPLLVFLPSDLKQDFVYSYLRWADLDLRTDLQGRRSVLRSTCLSPKPGHTTGGPGRGARRSSGAGSGMTGRRQNSSPRRQSSLAPSKASKTRRLTSLQKHEQAKSPDILGVPM